jgi:hypothetical protein
MNFSRTVTIWLRCGQRSALYSGGSAKVNGKEAVRDGTAGGSASRLARLDAGSAPYIVYDPATGTLRRLK